MHVNCEIYKHPKNSKRWILHIYRRYVEVEEFFEMSTENYEMLYWVTNFRKCNNIYIGSIDINVLRKKMHSTEFKERLDNFVERINKKLKENLKYSPHKEEVSK